MRLPITNEEWDAQQVVFTMDEIKLIHCMVKSYALEFPRLTPAFLRELKRKAEILGLDEVVQFSQERLAATAKKADEAPVAETLCSCPLCESKRRK